MLDIKSNIKKFICFLNGNKYNILSPTETLKYIKNKKISFARFGDGEMDIILGGNIGFQDDDIELKKRLEEVLQCNNQELLIGIVDALNYRSLKLLTTDSKKFWINNLYNTRKTWDKYLNKNQCYGNANVTRFYMRFRDKKLSKEIMNEFKKIWDNRKVIVVEGRYTRFGVGNEILSNALSVQRILCPEKNAFNKYNDILEFCKEISDEATLFILALGPTATILAYDLSLCGFQAIDLGHLDIEFEWYRKKQDHKIAILQKYTNEVSENNNLEDFHNDIYEKEIIKIVN